MGRVDAKVEATDHCCRQRLLPSSYHHLHPSVVRTEDWLTLLFRLLHIYMYIRTHSQTGVCVYVKCPLLLVAAGSAQPAENTARRWEKREEREGEGSEKQIGNAKCCLGLRRREERMSKLKLLVLKVRYIRSSSSSSTTTNQSACWDNTPEPGLDFQVSLPPPHDSAVKKRCLTSSSLDHRSFIWTAVSHLGIKTIVQQNW